MRAGPAHGKLTSIVVISFDALEQTSLGWSRPTAAMGRKPGTAMEMRRLTQPVPATV
jgi:hypothetical protein